MNTKFRTVIKIFEVAAMAGFSFQNNFERNFLKQCKTPPSGFQSIKQAEKKQ
jgi:transcriptional regulator GlxA family with amidase domain